MSHTPHDSIHSRPSHPIPSQVVGHLCSMVGLSLYMATANDLHTLPSDAPLLFLFCFASYLGGKGILSALCVSPHTYKVRITPIGLRHHFHPMTPLETWGTTATLSPPAAYHGRTGGRMEGQTDGRTDRRTGRLVGRRTGGRMGRRAYHQQPPPRAPVAPTPTCASWESSQSLSTKCSSTTSPPTSFLQRST